MKRGRARACVGEWRVGKRVGERACERGEGEGLDRKEDLAEKVLP